MVGVSSSNPYSSMGAQRRLDNSGARTFEQLRNEVGELQAQIDQLRLEQEQVRLEWEQEQNKFVNERAAYEQRIKELEAACRCAIL